MDLNGKVALITGAAQGIGKEIALTLVKSNAKVILSDINLEGVSKVAQEVEDLGGEALPVAMNVADSASVKEAVEQSKAKFGTIDILVNNAGITRDTLIMRMKEEDFDKVIAINLKGVFNCTREVLPLMIKNRSGKIVNISSIVGLMGNVGQANYAASKAGVIGFTKTVAREVAARGININAIAPGFIETAMTATLSDDVQDRLKALIPMKKLGSMADVAKAVLFLVSPDSEYITGQVLSVNGGMYM